MITTRDLWRYREFRKTCRVFGQSLRSIAIACENLERAEQTMIAVQRDRGIKPPNTYGYY